MDRIQNWLWKNLGVTLDRETKIVGGIVVAGTLLTILFGFLWIVSHSGLLLLLAVLSFAAVVIVLFGGSYRLVSWSLASKEERRKMEEEVAQKQLRRRSRDSSFLP